LLATISSLSYRGKKFATSTASHSSIPSTVHTLIECHPAHIASEHVPRARLFVLRAMHVVSVFVLHIDSAVPRLLLHGRLIVFEQFGDHEGLALC
jgi:hypothetical protein